MNVLRGITALAVTALLACSPADPLPGADAAVRAPEADIGGSDLGRFDAADPPDAAGPNDAAVIDVSVEPDEDVGPGADDAGPPPIICEGAQCGPGQICADVCEEGPICTGEIYGTPCVDNCTCVVGLECSDLTQTCVRCVSDGQCGDEECMRGPGLCAPRVVVGTRAALLRVLLHCAALPESNELRGCAELNTTMGLMVAGAPVDAVEPVSSAAGCGGISELTEEENTVLQTLLGCDGSRPILIWSVAVPTGQRAAGCVSMVPSQLSVADADVIVVADCAAPLRLTE